MARDMIKCPNCECKVSLSDVEKEEGLCPECGHMLVASTLFDDYDDDELDDDRELEDNEEDSGMDDDDFEDDFDDDFDESLDFDDMDEDNMDIDMDEDIAPVRRGRKRQSKIDDLDDF